MLYFTRSMNKPLSVWRTPCVRQHNEQGNILYYTKSIVCIYCSEYTGDMQQNTLPFFTKMNLLLFSFVARQTYIQIYIYSYTLSQGAIKFIPLDKIRTLESYLIYICSKKEEYSV